MKHTENYKEFCLDSNNQDEAFLEKRKFVNELFKLLFSTNYDRNILYKGIDANKEDLECLIHSELEKVTFLMEKLEKIFIFCQFEKRKRDYHLETTATNIMNLIHKKKFASKRTQVKNRMTKLIEFLSSDENIEKLKELGIIINYNFIDDEAIMLFVRSNTDEDQINEESPYYYFETLSDKLGYVDLIENKELNDFNVDSQKPSHEKPIEALKTNSLILSSTERLKERNTNETIDEENKLKLSEINKKFLPMYGLLEVQDYLKKVDEKTNASAAKVNDSLPPKKKPRTDNEFISYSENLEAKEQNTGNQNIKNAEIFSTMLRQKFKLSS